MQMDDGYLVTNGAGGSRADMWSRKRKAGDISDFERFERRLRQLTLRNENNRNGDGRIYAHATKPLAPKEPRLQASQKQPQPKDELMQVDNTSDRVFIPDIDAELADIEEEEERLIFLPDIEAKLSKLPPQLLQANSDDHEGQELVLYSVPKSLTVDEGHDSVRKAIIEFRQRAREKAAEEHRQDMERRYEHNGYDFAAAETAHGYHNGYEHGQVMEEDDPDAMDIG